MLVVFLDIDGVINQGFGPGEPSMVRHLNTILQRTGAVIVVHSSRRCTLTLENLQRLLYSWGVQEGTVLDKCPSPVRYSTTDSGIWVGQEDWDDFKRGIQSDHERCIAIQRWLDDHPGVQRFVILDDDPALGHFVGTPGYIRTKMKEGLTEEHVTRAVKHLKGVTW